MKQNFKANRADLGANPRINPANPPQNPTLNEVESYMNQKGVEYRTIDKSRAGRIYERLKAHIAPPKHTIQVLGTNGKGSTGRFLALMLMQNGASVVHFTSPHIFSFSERFYKNGAIIGDDELLKAHRFLQGFDFMAECSYFEYATFLAVVLAQNADYLILEAGVGGELDSTSVIARDLCVFSVIDYDHTEILGDSIEAIATTKLNAVFYPNRVSKMVVGAQKYEIVEKIARDIAKKNGVEFYGVESHKNSSLGASFALGENFGNQQTPSLVLSQNFLQDTKSPPQILEFDSSKSDSNDSSLRGVANAEAIQSYLTKHRLAGFLRQNLILALKALEILGLKCDLDSLPKLDLRGRFEQIAPNIIIDVGHNQNAAFAVKENLGQKKVILVYNSYFQKNISEILGILKDNILRVEILEVADNPRIIERKTLEKTLDSLGILYQNFNGVDSIDSQNDYLVFGSFSVVEAFMRDFMNHKKAK